MGYQFPNFAANTVWIVPLFTNGVPDSAAWILSMIARMKELEKENARLEHFNFQIVYKKFRLWNMKTASPEMRFIVIKAYQAGIPRQQLAYIVGYHLNSVSRWIREFNQAERLEARPRGHRASIFSDDDIKELTELIQRNVDMTLEEIREHFSKKCSLNAIHKRVKALGVVFKKNAEGKRTRSRRYCPSSSWMARFSEENRCKLLGFSWWNRGEDKYDEALLPFAARRALPWFSTMRTMGEYNCSVLHSSWWHNRMYRFWRGCW